MPEHVLFGVDEDRAHVEPGHLHRTKGPFDLREALVGRHCRVGVDGCGVEIGPDDVDTVQACLGLDLLPVAGPLQIVIGDGEVEVFLHLMPVGLSAEGLQGPARFSGPGLCLRAAAAIFARVASVARSRSSRLRARSGAAAG